MKFPTKTFLTAIAAGLNLYNLLNLGLKMINTYRIWKWRVSYESWGNLLFNDINYLKFYEDKFFVFLFTKPWVAIKVQKEQ